MPAARNIEALTLYPSAKTSAEWADVSAAVRNNAFFSACIEDERLLAALQQLVAKATEEGWSVGLFLDEALQMLDNIAADTSTKKAETFRDNFEQLYNVERLRLIYLTQRELSAGYFNFQNAFSPYQLYAYPAWKFHRQPGAKEQNKRADHVQHEGEVRLKTDIAYWLDRNRAEIGGFGNPYGPWGFNSWMRELPVRRRDAEAMGLVKRGEKLSIPPALAEWGLQQAIQQTGQASVPDLTNEQQQRVVDRCAQEGIKVVPKEPEQSKPVAPQPVRPTPPTQPAKPLPPQGNTLQVVPNPDNPNDPLTRLEEATTDAWLNEEAQRIDSMGESEWLGMLLGGFLADKIFRKPKKKEEKLQASRLRKQPITLPDGTRCFTEDCERHEVSLAAVQAAKKAVQKYKATRMRDAQAHAKAVLPREVATPLPDVPLAALNGSDIKEMLNPKALFASACNGVSPDVHEEAVLRTTELLRNANEVSRRAGGKKSRLVMKNGKEVWQEDPIAEIVELDAIFHAANKEKYTARYSVQKYKKPNMKPKVYFMYCRKPE